MNSVEAILFSSDEPIKASEIADILSEEIEKVSKAIKSLRSSYAKSGAIEIAKVGQRYVMQLKEEYNEYAYAVTKRELNDEILKTLALIAYYQPIKQSDLRDIAGSKVYENVAILKQKKLISSRVSGKTLELKTTKQFNLYFGINATKPEDIRKLIEAKMGLDVRK
jgi:segregation and condensation protein B